jgi:ABC-type iron transport system FetAB permease component
MLIGITLVLIGFLLSIGASYLTANAICQRAWKEKIAQSKLIGFTAIFVITLFTLTALILVVAANIPFGR